MKTIGKNLKLRNGVVYGVATIAGRQRWKKSPIQGVMIPTAALIKWRDKWLKDERARSVVEALKETASKTTWRQLIDAYWQVSAAEFAESGRPSRETVAENIVKTRTMLSQMNIQENDPLDMATPERVSAWIAMRATDERARYSAGRTMAQATSLWSRWSRPRYELRGIDLPACLDRWPRIRAMAPKYVDPPDELKRKTVEMGEEFYQKGRSGSGIDSDLFLAFTLMFNFGMRPGDACRAEWSWFVEKSPFEIKLVFTPHKTNRSAGGRVVEQRVPSDLWLKMKPFKRCFVPGDRFVIAETEDGRQNRVLEELNTRLRNIGWKTEKAAYELRKLFVSAVYNAHGLQWASAYSGDNATTIERYYAAAYRRDAPTVDVGKVVAGS